eukprot:TRINITY_DN3908_c1_g1_i2.p1 TRINITY_DN3908_c1_g1~~TRINITY_DN3908_c1_g1_i2.p1  ORF type:complete len:209 (-),score=33.60 TRINITY_DN3908_c1_g1_i2:213-839(-)
MSDHDYVVKVIVNGDGSVGKSSLLLRYLKGEFHESTTMTIGVDTGTKVLEFGDLSVKAQIWDTAGQERYRGITSTYYRGAAGAIVVYDVTSKESFDNCKTWISEIRKHSVEDIVIGLVGNKVDLEDQRVVSTEEGEKYAEDNNLTFVETSAATGANVSEAFEYTVKEAVSVMSKRPTDELETKKQEQTVKLDNRNTESGASKKKGGCC